jgi:hypothetical protein
MWILYSFIFFYVTERQILNVCSELIHLPMSVYSNAIKTLIVLMFDCLLSGNGGAIVSDPCTTYSIPFGVFHVLY